MVEHSCVSTAAITRDCYSPRHKDPNDNCKGGPMSAVAWFLKELCPDITLSLARCVKLA